MKTYLMLAAAAVALSGCASALGGGQTFNGDALMKILTDPNCGHDDSIDFATTAGGVPAYVKGSAARHCPMPNGLQANTTVVPVGAMPVTPSK